jgi:UDP-GlcNAc:undecaprenyl-phosphate GlcNAc-1-phosphate transferase
MRSVFAAFLLSLGVSALLTPLVRRLAFRVGAMDAGGGRKVHVGFVPRMGGIAIVVGFLAPLTPLLFLDAGINALFLADERKVVGLFLGSIAIAALGLLDDLRGADARKKFVVQFGVAALVWAAGFRIEIITNPFGDAVDLGILALPVTLLWIAGVINALNLIDGLDGLAGGVALFVLSTLFALGYLQDRVLVCLLCAALGGAVVGFLFYNFNPATIFMGDTGSLFLGFVVSLMSILGSQKSSTAVAVAIPLLALGLPLADTALAMFRRALRGRSMFSADREHIHHKLLDLGMTHRQAVLVLYGASLVLAFAAFSLVFLSSLEATALLTVMAAAAVVLFHRMGYLSLETLRREMTVGRANSRAFREKRDVIRSTFLSAAREGFTLDTALESLLACGAVVGFSEVTLALNPPALGFAERKEMTAVVRPCKPNIAGLSICYPLDGDVKELGEVTYLFRDGRVQLTPDEASLLDLMHDQLIERVEHSMSSSVIPLRRRAG